MSTPLSPTARLGGFVAATARAPLPPAVAQKAASCLLDALGLALAGADEPTVRALRSLLTPVADGAARVWADGTRAALGESVALNAAAVHALFHDDNDPPSWSHPASLVTPVAVGVGESIGATVADVLRALAIGYAAISWLGARERVGRALIARGIRTSPTLGTPAAAAAAAALYRLDAGAATHAIGIASSITGGVLEPVRCGSDEWRIQNAHAACGGLLAAQLAARGVRGAPQGLEGPKGLAHAFAGLDAVPEWDHEPRTESLLEVWAKPWATLGDNVPAVAAAHALRDSGAAPQRIAAVRVTIWRHYADYPGTAYRGPFDSVAQALASTAFGVAAMLAIGRLDYAVSAERRNDPAILRLVSCVTVTAHDGAWHEAEVEVELDDGSRISRRSADAPRTLLFHDETAAAAVFEHRLAEAGVTGGKALAGAVFGAAHGAPLAVAELLDRLSSPQRRRQA